MWVRGVWYGIDRAPVYPAVERRGGISPADPIGLGTNELGTLRASSATASIPRRGISTYRRRLTAFWANGGDGMACGADCKCRPAKAHTPTPAPALKRDRQKNSQRGWAFVQGPCSRIHIPCTEAQNQASFEFKLLAQLYRGWHRGRTLQPANTKAPCIPRHNRLSALATGGHYEGGRYPVRGSESGGFLGALRFTQIGNTPERTGIRVPL